MLPIEGEDSIHPLLAAGWRTGVVFQAPGANYEWNIRAEEQGRLQIGSGSSNRIVRQKECLILISHACDICDKGEKYIEALICRPEDPNKSILDNWQRNSPKYFIVDRLGGIVADASHRIKIDKQALIGLAPIGELAPWILADFTRWLARRYFRPTVPDLVYTRFHRPVFTVLDNMSNSDPDLWYLFNSHVKDVRVHFESPVQWPLAIGLLYVTQQTGLSDEVHDAIRLVHRQICELVSADIYVEPEPAIEPFEEIPYTLILRTQPLYLEYASVESAGATPSAPQQFSSLD